MSLRNDLACYLACARTNFQLLFLFVGLASMSAQPAEAQDSRGHLVIIGGGLRYDNHAIFDAMIRYAGGADRARVVVLPTASISTPRFTFDL